MKKNYIFAFAASAVFALAAVLNFIAGSSLRGALCLIATISLGLAGYHWRRNGPGQNRP